MKPSFELRPLKSLGHALALAGLLAASLPSQAAISLVTSRVALGGTDSLTWGQLGGDSGNPLPIPAPGVTSFGGISATVSNLDAPGELFRFDEGGQSSGFVGSFGLNDQLLSTFNSPGPLVITFATPVARVGAQIQSLDTGGPQAPALPFTGYLQAFGASGSLGIFSVPGGSGMAQDNTAPFIGVVSTGVDITSIHFYVTDTPLLDFAINTVSLSVTPVPEPATYLMSLVGGAFLLSVASRRRKAVH